MKKRRPLTILYLYETRKTLHLWKEAFKHIKCYITYVLDPVERLYSFINHCVNHKWQFCQKWNFQIEPIIEYATKFFEKYNSTSWYHGIRSSTTGYPPVWYDDFINVSFP